MNGGIKIEKEHIKHAATPLWMLQADVSVMCAFEAAVTTSMIEGGRRKAEGSGQPRHY